MTTITSITTPTRYNTPNTAHTTGKHSGKKSAMLPATPATCSATLPATIRPHRAPHGPFNAVKEGWGLRRFRIRRIIAADRREAHHTLAQISRVQLA
jgi:hypothetical protein